MTYFFQNTAQNPKTVRHRGVFITAV